MIYECVFRKFGEKKIKYLVVGGIAVNLHGFPRVTGDLDIMLDLKDEKTMEQFVEVIKELGFKPRVPVIIDDFSCAEKRELWIEEKNMKVFSVYNPSNEIEHIDVLIENPIDFESAYKRREIFKADDIKIPVISIDDLIIMKKNAGRKRDQIDISALYEIKKIKNERK